MAKQRNKIIFILFVAVVFALLLSTFTSDTVNAACTGGGLSIPKCDNLANDGNVPLSENPILLWIGFFINLLSVVIIAGASLMIAFSGLQYATSRDNAQNVQAAKSKIWNTILGLIAFCFLYGFIQWIIPGGVWSSTGELNMPSYNPASEVAYENSTISDDNQTNSPVPTQPDNDTDNTNTLKSTWPDNEEFNTINTKIWRLYDRSNGAETFGHTDPKALQLYANEQIAAKNGAMVITAVKQSNGKWKSGFASSKETKHFMPLYGRIEVRAQLPHEPGIWPAIWLRHRSGSNVAEVDIAEVFYTGGDSVSQSLHFPKTVGTHLISKGVDFPDPSGWHVYWSDIRPTKNGAIKFTLGVDNKTTDSYTISESKAKYVKAVDNNATWAVALNIAVTNNKWSGNANKASSPQVMKVDWVRWSK